MVEPQNFHIRKAESADGGGILLCLAEAFEPYQESYTAEAFRDTVLDPKTLPQRMGSMCLFVAATSSGEIIGTIGCSLANAQEGHVRGMAVRTAWQGAGVADRLLDSAEFELRVRNCLRVTLDTTLPLQRAMRFYEKHGYRRSGHTRDFFGMILLEYVKDLKHIDRQADRN